MGLDLKIKQEKTFQSLVEYLETISLKVGEVIGRGKSGVVYILRSLNEEDSEKRVIKIIHLPNLVFHQRREDHLTNATVSPHVLKIKCLYSDHGRITEEPGEYRPLVAYLMPYVDGWTLKEYLPHVASSAHAVQIVLQIASALQSLHQNKIAHCNLTPQNIMIGRDGTVKILGFGITKQYVEPSTHEIQDAEQVDKSDVFSLGLIFYELLGSQLTDLPTEHEPYQERIASMLEEIPSPFQPLLMGMLEKEAQKRWSIDQVIAELSQFL